LTYYTPLLSAVPSVVDSCRRIARFILRHPDARLGEEFFVLVAGERLRRLTAQAVLDLTDDLVGTLGDARPGNHRQDELVLGVVGGVVPPVPFVVVGRVGRVAVRLLLTDERPGLVELDLAGPRGKKP
jgi:hypothetical protein